MQMSVLRLGFGREKSLAKADIFGQDAFKIEPVFTRRGTQRGALYGGGDKLLGGAERLFERCAAGQKCGKRGCKHVARAVEGAVKSIVHDTAGLPRPVIPRGYPDLAPLRTYARYRNEVGAELGELIDELRHEFFVVPARAVRRIREKARLGDVRPRAL